MQVFLTNILVKWALRSDFLIEITYIVTVYLSGVYHH